MATISKMIKADCPAEGCDQAGVASLTFDESFNKLPPKDQKKKLNYQRKLLKQILQGHHDKGHPKKEGE